MLTLISSLIKRVFISVLLLVITAIIVNWVFAAVFGGQIRTFDRRVGGRLGILLSVIVLMFLIILFPLFYLGNIKFLALASIVQTIRGQYKDEFMELVVGRAVKTTLALHQGSQTILAHSQDRFTDLPRPVRRFFGYLKQKIPFISQVEEVMEQVYREREWTEHDLQQEVMTKLTHTIQETDLPMDRGYIWRVIGVNCLLLIGLGLVIGV